MTTGQPAEAQPTTNSSTPAISIDSATPGDLKQRCAQVHKAVYTFLEQEYSGEDEKSRRLQQVQRQVTLSLGIIAEALERYTLDELSLSYNGGKDCLVLLLLYLAGLHHKAIQDPAYKFPAFLPSVYITLPEPFPAVTHFVTTSAAHYRLQLAAYPSEPSMREAFAGYLAAAPQVRAIFVGTRRTDPHGANLRSFDPTDRGWPAFVRVHPVLDWHYAEIWAFIRELGVEYCSLYDEGYTSLGGKGDTKPNPALKMAKSKKSDAAEVDNLEGDTESPRFRPAYELLEDDEERLGRDG